MTLPAQYVPMSPLISEGDACAWLGVDLRALRRMVRAGLLKRGTFGCYNRQDVMSLAEARLAERLQAPLEPQPEPTTLHDVAEAWWLPRLQRKKALTRRRYIDCYVAHVRDRIGLIPVRQLTTAQVQEVIDQMSDDGLGSSSQSVCRTVISTILREAQKRGLVDRLVTADRLVEVDPSPPKRVRVMDAETAARLLDAVDGTRLSAPVFLAVVLGLRRGEICGLRWEDLDRQRRELTIKRQRQMVYERKRAGKPRKRGTAAVVHEGDLKGSQAGQVKTLVLPAEVIAEIDRRGDLDSEYICTRDGRHPWRPDSLTREWTSNRAALGLPSWTLHDNRHGSGGLMRAAGMDLVVIARALGHADTRTTQIYVDADRSDVGKAIQGVDTLIQRARRKQT